MKLSFSRIRHYCLEIVMRVIYNPLMFIENKLSGVKSNGGNKYYGRTYISKADNSSIFIGKGCVFNSLPTSNLIGNNHKCIISTMTNDAIIRIGNNCGFSGTSIICASSVIIGNNVRCGANSTILGTDGHWSDFRAGENLPVVIEDNVWIGASAIIMKGIKIGRGAFVGAGSVVRKNIPPYAICVGNPGKIIGFVSPPEEIVKLEEKEYQYEERYSIDLLKKNYDRFYLNRRENIRQYLK